MSFTSHPRGFVSSHFAPFLLFTPHVLVAVLTPPRLPLLAFCTGQVKQVGFSATVATKTPYTRGLALPLFFGCVATRFQQLQERIVSIPDCFGLDPARHHHASHHHCSFHKQLPSSSYVSWNVPDIDPGPSKIDHLLPQTDLFEFRSSCMQLNFKLESVFQSASRAT